MPSEFMECSLAVEHESRDDYFDVPEPHEVVISGIAGRFPDCNNVEEFKEKLLQGIDLITVDDRRWPPGFMNTPLGSGKVNDIDKFDSVFFGFPATLAHESDPQLRMLLEVAYEAIVDAGINPQSFRGSNTAVLTGCCERDAETAFINSVNLTGYSLFGCSNTMLANRVSFAFDLKGPSGTIDTACSSCMFGYYVAVKGIMTGQFDNALVLGSNLTFRPIIAAKFLSLYMMSPTSRSMSFDAAANGFARSETIGAVLLQRACQAKRIYSTVLNARCNADGYKKEGIAFPSGAMQAELLKTTYKEVGANPLDVSYVEAHGTGTKVGDPQEVNAIAEVLCKNRKEPLYIGAVKSVMGHPEGSAGICQIAKAIITIREGIIPPNLHYNNPNPECIALTNGQLQVITKCTKFKKGLIGITSSGFGGCNIHTILRPYMKRKSVVVLEKPELFVITGRTEEAVEVMLSALEKDPNPHMLALLSDIMDSPPSLHPFRGYTILNSKPHIRAIQNVDPEQRPMWYIFTGMGSQWVGMGQDMMSLDVFKKSMEKSHDALKPYGIDLMNLIMNPAPNQFDKILNSFVTIAAIQVALVDCLRSVGIEPDGMVGHSVGELGCAYADGCLTAEQMVLAAFWRGYCVEHGHLPKGSMAAVGLTWDEVEKRCPSGVVCSCHNAEDSVTISGPQEEMQKFMEQLKTENIFVKEVNTSNRAFHCYMVNSIAPALLKNLEELIPSPKPRTCRWISTSIPEKDWNSPLAKSSSGAYFVNNLVSSVLFYEGLQHVPENAIAIEIAPHCLLQAILKRTLSTKVMHIGLAHRDKPDNYKYFLTCLGKLYTSGYNFKPSKLYCPVSFPVPIDTPMISPLIKWDHSATWRIPKYTDFGSDQLAAAATEVDISNVELKHHYLVDHKIDGRIIYPGAGYLLLVWQSFAKTKNVKFDDIQIQFEDVVFHRATILSKTAKTVLEVTVMKGSGAFEIMEGGSLVVSGHIYLAKGRPHENLGSAIKKVKTNDSIRLVKSDVYKEFRLRGYEYGPNFQGVIESSLNGQEGKLIWNGNWVTYIDSVFQFLILDKSSRDLYLPTRIPFLRIDPRKQPKEPEDEIEVYYDKVLNACISGGVQIVGLKAAPVFRRGTPQSSLIEEYQFIPNNEDRCFISLPDFEKNLKDYNALLSKTVKEGISKIMQNNKKLYPNLGQLHTEFQQAPIVDLKPSSFFENENFNTSAYEFLKNIFSVTIDQTFFQTIEILVDLFWVEIAAKDTLLSSLRHSRALRPCLDIVLENFLSHTFKVVEVESSKVSLMENLKNEFLNLPHAHMDLTLTDINESTLSSIEEGDKVLSCMVWNPVKSPFLASEAHLIVASYFFFRNIDCLEIALNNFSKSLKPGGFALFIEFEASNPVAKLFATLHKQKACPSRNELVNGFNKAGLKIICIKSDGILNTLYLVRKVMPVKKSYILSVDGCISSWIEKLKQYHATIHKEPEGVNIYIISEKQPTSGIIGLVNCLRAEGGERIRSIFNSTLKAMKPISYEEIYEKDLVMNVYQDGKWGSFHFLPLSSEHEELFTKTTHAYANLTVLGNLTSLRWIESPLKFNHKKNSNKPLYYVYYSSINFRDIMIASGKLPLESLPDYLSSEDIKFGLEFSGRTEEGKRIMGICRTKGLATVVQCDSSFLWDVPDNWSLEEAASVPIIYTTVYYSLIIRGQLQPGESILIHSGTGGIGQAAISVALNMDCTVYTTVGSLEKRKYLKKCFPQLTDDNFANSHSITFEYDIMKATNGKGVDVILNSLAEEKLQASVRCLAFNGRFLEIGKYDLAKNTNLGMSCFLKNTSFHGILLDSLFDLESPVNTILKRLVDKGINSGVVKPIKCTVFEKDQLEEAFRFMASGKHIGKVVIKIRNEEREKITRPPPVVVDALAQVLCHPKKAYIITGGLGGFGLELAYWLVNHGARNITLTTHSRVRTGYQARCIKQWKEKGVNVIISTHDITTLQGVQNLIQDAVSQQGTVGGIFHLAMVLKDALLENQNVELYNAVINPKVKGAENLDAVSRKQCPDLDWFVVFSSVVAGRGNGGQTNYGFANSAMERICEKRHQDGLNGLAIQWGAVGDVGVVYENMGGNNVVIGGCIPQRITSCLSVLEKLLNQSHPVISSIVPAEKQNLRSKSKSNMSDTVAHILGLKDVSNLNPDVPIAEMGLDSLMAVEMKHTIEHAYDIVLSMQDINQLTLTKLKEIEKKSNLGDTSEKSLTENDSQNRVKQNLRFDFENLNPEKCITPLNSQTQGLPLFIVHPLDGNVQMLKTLSEKLMLPVYGIQCTLKTPLNTLEAMAAYYVQEMMKIQAEGPYQLAGYSYGCITAFEMAIQLQQAHSTNLKIVQNLIMLDGSPHLVSSLLTGYHFSTEAGTQAYGLISFVEMFIEINANQERQKLEQLSTWDERVNYIVQLLTQSKLFKTSEEIVQAANSYFNRITIACKYLCNKKFNGDISLVRVKHDVKIAEDPGPYYSLDKVCTGNVKLVMVDGTHQNFILNPNAEATAKEINEIVAPKF